MVLNPRHLVFLLAPTLLAAQQKSELQQILERLDRLEQENLTLTSEVRALRQELAGSRTAAPAASLPSGEQPPLDQIGDAPVLAAPLAERVGLTERRIEELAQTKVEASQRFPISLTGMALFNAFLNGKSSGGQQDPTVASLANSAAVGGATLAQSVIGLKYQGPQVFGSAHVNGTLYLDLFGGTTSSLNHLIRLRVATVQIDWKNQSVMVGQDKPIIAPREPNSLAQVGVSPLTGAGNLWLWQPQARFEQRLSLGAQTGLRAQIGVYQTSEPASSAGAEYAATLSPSRPALEGRFEFWRQFGEGKRIEIAPGFHTSSTHVAGTSIPSDLFSIDWMIQPQAWIQFTGMFFNGENAAGVGGLRQGFNILDDKHAVAIGAIGGWTQASIFATKRLSFNLYSGQESDRASDLLTGQIRRNLTYAGNAIYRLGPNVLLGLEASQVRTDYLNIGRRLNNHYDLALGYLF